MRTKTIALAAAAVALSTGLSSCGLGTAGGYTPTGTLAGPVEGIDFSGETFSVGSKQHNEGVTMGKMAVILLRSAGAKVTDLSRIPGSSSARMAQIEGQIDILWDYTGTAWLAYLGHEKPVKGQQEQFDAVAEEDLEKNDIVWLGATPLNNTYAFAAKRETSEELGIDAMSGFSDIPESERTFCVDSEFASRTDGFEPMLETYGVPLGSGTPSSNVNTMGAGPIYAATANGRCNFGMVYATDGRIEALDLVVMKDDKEFFPSYNASALIREEVLAEHPQLKDLLLPLTERMTDEVFLELNAEVDVEGRPNTDVAYDWLVHEGFLAQDG